MTPTITRLDRPEKGWIQGLALGPDGALWALLYRCTVLRSLDGGDTWAAVPSPSGRWLTAIAVTPDGAVLVGDEKGALHETRDLGQTWEHTPLRGGRHLWSALVTPDAALVGVGGNVYRRRHGEPGWTRARKGPRGSAVRRLSGIDDGTLFVSCAHTHLDRAAWRSLDGGDTWQRVLEDVSSQLLDVHASGDRVYARLDSGDLLASDDRGVSWHRHPLPFDVRGPRIWSAGAVLYAFDVPHKPATDGAISEVWRSPDGGETWTMLCAFALAVRSFASTAAGDIVLGGCVDDRGAIARWRDPEVAAFLTARAIAPALEHGPPADLRHPGAGTTAGSAGERLRHGAVPHKGTDG